MPFVVMYYVTSKTKQTKKENEGGRMDREGGGEETKTNKKEE